MIVGLTGRAGVGKSTHALALINYAEHHMGIQGGIYPFAGPLKRIAMSMGWNGKKDEKGRRLLQILGTECGRECIGEDVWVNLWRDQVRGCPMGWVAVADDVRFDNEVEAIHALGGLVVQLRGDGYAMTPEAEQHVSERVPEAYNVTWERSNTRDPYELAKYLFETRWK